MYSWAKPLVLTIAMGSAVVMAEDYNPTLESFGRPATADELKAWDIDVRPDFLGLPEGSGDAYTGEEIWLEKCASCHGDFGDSNEIFSPLVLGNITEDDIETGRVEALLDGVNTRTTLMKVSTLSTIWDYINRAMPWNAPKSLSTDEVYSLVAYLLSLGYIIEPDFELSHENIEEVQALMPNRNGMTRDHGLWSVSGTPDVVGSDCTRDCEVSVEVTSFIPEYAMNAHGNLKDQMRDYGPFPGLQTATVEEAANVEANDSGEKAPMALLTSSGCTACHQLNKSLIGPAYADVMAKYAGRADAASYLAKKIKAGGSGVWGSMAMPPMPVDEATAQTIAQWLAGSE